MAGPSLLCAAICSAVVKTNSAMLLIMQERHRYRFPLVTSEPRKSCCLPPGQLHCAIDRPAWQITITSGGEKCDVHAITAKK
jgi:hypothetical protein